MTDVLVDTETGEILDDEPVADPEPDAVVEPVEDDEPVEPEDDHEPGDEQLRQVALQQAAQTEREVEKKNRELANEAKRHAGRIVSIMGDDAEILGVCPLCLPLIPGFRYPQVPQGEQFAAVKAAIGESAEPELQGDTYSALCTKCEGFGSVDTGSKVLGQAKVQCIDCKGRGWIPRGSEREGGTITALQVVPGAISYDQAAPDAPDPPEVAALKAQGYIVVAPIPAPAA